MEAIPKSIIFIPEVHTQVVRLTIKNISCPTIQLPTALCYVTPYLASLAELTFEDIPANVGVHKTRLSIVLVKSG